MNTKCIDQPANLNGPDYFNFMNRSDAVKLARQLRKNSIKPELKIWEEVRNRRLNGLKFTRQFPIEFKLFDN